MCRGSQSQCTRVYLAQVQFVLVTNSYMVAERLLDARSPVFTHPSALLSETIDFAWTVNFKANQMALQIQDENSQQLAFMCAAGLLANCSWNKDGRMVSYIWDKAKEVLVEETPEEFGVLCETYNLPSSVSLQATPVNTPDKDGENNDGAEQPTNFVAGEVNRLHKVYEKKIKDLEKLNGEQGRMIAFYCREKASNSTEDCRTCSTSRDSRPTGRPES